MTADRNTHETHLIEWKESWRDEYLKWLCGFANADGGTLIIGMNDAGEPVGVPDAGRLLIDLPNKIRDTLGLVVPVRVVNRKGKELVEIEVGPSLPPISYKGEYHFRSGSTKQQLTGNALSTFLLRKFGRTWDGSPVPNVGVKNLSVEAFKRFKGYARASDRLPPGALALSRTDLVEKLRLTETGMLKRAALLLFHDDPERWVTGAYVKIGMFRSESDLAYHDEVHGDLFTQMDKTIELLTTKYMVAWISYRGLGRVETFPVPREALREAVLNALIHKDYGSGTPIQIRVYRDRLRIWNPGELPPSWTAERLLGPHESRPPNPDVANCFFRAGLIEAWGRGYDKIREACEDAGAPAPKVELDGGLRLSWNWQVPNDTTLVSTPAMVETTEGNEPVRGQVRDQVRGQVRDQVGDQVARLLLAMTGTMTRDELQTALALEGRRNFSDRYLKPAVAAGLIEMTVPDKPNSRLQKYRLTPAGKALAAATRTRTP
jgi:ATP-dependent DNA helicase RecG